MRSERIQYNLLQMQNASNVWRKAAFKLIMENRHQLCGIDEDSALHRAVHVFHEPLDFTLQNAVVEPTDISEVIRTQVEANKEFIADSDSGILKAVTDNVGRASGAGDLTLRQKSYEEPQVGQLDQEQEQEQVQCIDIGRVR